MRKIVLCVLLSMQALLTFAQESGGVSGKVVDAKTQRPMANVVVSVMNTNLGQLTDLDGNFRISGMAAAEQMVQIKSAGFRDRNIPVVITPGQISDLGVVV